MRFLSMLLLVLLAASTGVQAQTRPPETLVERWVASQERAARRAGDVRCREESLRRIDSPKGAREIHTVSRLHSRAGTPHLDRDIEHVAVNGRAVPAEEQGRIVRYLRHGRSGAGSLTDMLTLFGPLMRPLVPEELPRADPLAGGSMRADLLGSPGGGVERLTLWFDARSERLLQSRLRVRHDPDAAPIVVETHYRRVRGLDLPERRSVEGTMQVRRRSRSFTLLYKQTLTYECRVE